MVHGRAPQYNGFKSILLTDLRSNIPDFIEIGHPIFLFFPYFYGDRTRFYASSDCCDPEYRCFTREFPPNLRSDNEWSAISKKVKNLGGKTPNSKINAQKSQNLRTSGPTPVVRGGSGAKAPPLAARPKQRCQAGFCLHQCVLRNSLAGSKKRFLCPGTTLWWKVSTGWTKGSSRGKK